MSEEKTKDNKENEQFCECGHRYWEHKYIDAFNIPCEKCRCKHFKLKIKKRLENENKTKKSK